ncbi:MAG: hypothetical protein CMF46_02530 [Legionellales bacterium]|nr:hypothetical protein [Legionellales bacterium]
MFSQLFRLVTIHSAWLPDALHPARRPSDPDHYRQSNPIGVAPSSMSTREMLNCVQHNRTSEQPGCVDKPKQGVVVVVSGDLINDFHTKYDLVRRLDEQVGVSDVWLMTRDRSLGEFECHGHQTRLASVCVSEKARFAASLSGIVSKVFVVDTDPHTELADQISDRIVSQVQDNIEPANQRSIVLLTDPNMASVLLKSCQSALRASSIASQVYDYDDVMSGGFVQAALLRSPPC